LRPELGSAAAEVEMSASATPARSAYLVIEMPPLNEAPHLTGIYPSRKALRRVVGAEMLC
jgi:hypothetical protein